MTSDKEESLTDMMLEHDRIVLEAERMGNLSPEQKHALAQFREAMNQVMINLTKLKT